MSVFFDTAHGCCQRIFRGRSLRAVYGAVSRPRIAYHRGRKNLTDKAYIGMARATNKCAAQTDFLGEHQPSGVLLVVFLWCVSGGDLMRCGVV